MAQVDVNLYADTNTGSVLSTLANAFGMVWQDVPNGLGSFSMQLPLGDADVALCTKGRVVRFGHSGERRWAGVIDASAPTPIEFRTEGIESVTISGPGLGIELDEAKTRPKPAASDAPGTIADITPVVDDRPMDWYGMDYDRSTGWSVCTKLADHGETSAVWPGLPGGMRNLSADWIWSASPGAEDEFRFFYQWINITTAGEYVLDFAAYDAACYINGRKFGSNASYGEKQRVSFQVVNTGYILLCFEAEKRSTADAGLIWQITAGEEGALVAASSTSMYVRAASGDYMTSTEILLTLKADHDALDDWTFDFTATLDTDGNSVTGTSAVTARIGDDSLWDVMTALSEVYIDFDVSVADKVLSVWEKGTKPAASSLPIVAGGSTAHLVDGDFVNVVELAWEEPRARFNALMVRDSKGWFERPATLPTSPRFGSLGLPHIESRATATQFADAVLSNAADRDTATLELVQNLPADQLPYVAFDKWSILSVPSADDLDSTVALPVKALTCQADGDGELVTIVELGSLVEDEAERIERWIARTTRGGLSGQSQAAQGITRSLETATPPLNQTEVVLFDCVDQVDGATKSRTMPLKGLVHKLIARTDDPSGGTSSVTVTIAGVATVLSGTNASGFQLLDIDEGLGIQVDPRTVAALTMTTVGHEQITIYAAVSETR